MNAKILTVLAVFAAGAAFAESHGVKVTPDEAQYGEYGELETSLTGMPGNPEEGIKVATNRGLGNCVACHQSRRSTRLPGRGRPVA